VLAHEFGHIKNRDILVSSIAAMVAGAIAAIANIFQFSLLFGGDDEDTGPLGWIGLVATIIVAPVAASLYAVNPLARQGVATLFATHPPIAERVRRLRALDDDQALGLAA
jgi:Zn-dependent protease with chaperone function